MSEIGRIVPHCKPRRYGRRCLKNNLTGGWHDAGRDEQVFGRNQISGTGAIQTVQRLEQRETPCSSCGRQGITDLTGSIDLV